MNRLLLGLLFGLSLTAPVSAAGRRPGGYTLLVIPAKFATVQVGRDFVDRQGVLLLSYDTTAPADQPFLNAWNGERWVNVPLEAYVSGSFVQVAPGRTVVVGQPTAQVAKLIEWSALWTPQVLNVESEATADLVNSMGRFLGFKRREWEWYAARYQLKLEDLNYEARHQSWYDTHTASMLPPATSPFQAPLPPVQVREGTVRRPAPLSPEPIRAMPAATPPGSNDIESFSFTAD